MLLYADAITPVAAAALPQNVLLGAGVGSIAGRVLVHEVERRGGRELSAMHVRRIETTSTLLGAAFGLGYWVLFAR